MIKDLLRFSDRVMAERERIKAAVSAMQQPEQREIMQQRKFQLQLAKLKTWLGT